MEEKNKSVPAVAKQLDASVMSVITEKQLGGFEKAYQISAAIIRIKELLTDEYMKPIMALQGNKLGFKTDKDTSGGYKVEEVRNCLVEAVLIGLSPYGNQFNIIKSNMYPTKEGFGKLLKDIHGLIYDIAMDIPKMTPIGATINADISWTYKGEKKQKVIPLAIKTDQYTSADAVIGKATRKARAWLYNTVTGYELSDGDVADVTATVVASRTLDQITAEDLQILLDSKAEFVDDVLFKNATRVIEKNETANFKKIHDALKALG